MLRELLKIRSVFAVLMEMVDLKSVMWRNQTPLLLPAMPLVALMEIMILLQKPNDGCEGNGMKTIVQQFSIIYFYCFKVLPYP